MDLFGGNVARVALEGCSGIRNVVCGMRQAFGSSWQLSFCAVGLDDDNFRKIPGGPWAHASAKAGFVASSAVATCTPLP